jgi:hypothetical protein
MNINNISDKNLYDKTETEFVDYKRIFYGDFDNINQSDNKTKKSNVKKAREKRFITVFLAQSAICLIIISSALVLKYSKPAVFESVSSVLNGFYENNITLSDLNKLIDDRIVNNDALAAFFNFTPESFESSDTSESHE